MTNFIEKLREPDWEDNSLLETFLGSFKSRYVIPLDIGRFAHDSTSEGALKLFLLLIFFIVLAFTLLFRG